MDFSWTTESSKTADEVSVKDWINTSISNHTREIMRKFGNMLMKEYNNREKIAIGTIEGIPQFVTNIQNHSIVFNNLRFNYEIDNSDYSDFNEFKCAEHLQVNISKFINILSITGSASVEIAGHKKTNEITISLERTLISNVRKVQVINSQIVQMNGTLSETNIQYAEMKTDIKANEKDTPLILSSIPLLLEKMKGYFHQKIDQAILEKMREDLPIPEDFQCSTNGIGTYSTLLNKMYIIDEKENDVAQTHTVAIGPVVMNGFSNISTITWEYAWSADNKSYRKIVMNVGPLSAKSDWDITLSHKNKNPISSYTDKFIIQNAKLISILKPEQITYLRPSEYSYHNMYRNEYSTTEKPFYEHRYTFEAEIETKVSERAPSYMDDVLCANLEKLISRSFLNSLNIYNNKLN